MSNVGQGTAVVKASATSGAKLQAAMPLEHGRCVSLLAAPEFVLERAGRRVAVPSAMAGQWVTVDVRGGVDDAMRAAGF
jgi:hypothetical protein